MADRIDAVSDLRDGAPGLGTRLARWLNQLSVDAAKPQGKALSAIPDDTSDLALDLDRPDSRDAPLPDPFGPDVVVIDGVFHLRITGGLTLPFLQHGMPLRHLGDGWHIHALVSGFAPLLLLELRHDGGQRATWFFDSIPAYVGNTVAALPASLRKMLVHKASALLDVMLTPVVGPVRPYGAEPSPGAAEFFSVSEIARRQIGEACRDGLLPPADVVLAANLPPMLLVRPAGPGGQAAWITQPLLAASLAVNFQARLLAALRDGQLTWPSPVDGAEQPCSGSLVFNDFDQAYRIEDVASGLVYFLLVSQHVATFCGLYFPSENLIIAPDEPCRQIAAARFVHVAAMLVDDACRCGDTLGVYLQQQGKPLTAFVRDQHIGHQLWNDLSGLDHLIDSVDPAVLPELLQLGGRSSAFFGPLDEIFPEFRGKIGPDVGTTDALVAYAHRHGLIMARFNASFVSTRLRARIARRAAATPAGQAVAALRAGQTGMVIVLGVRVENRTVVDLAGFLGRLIDHIAQIAPGADIVLDGQNGREGDESIPVGSFADFLAPRTPLAAELELCSELIAGAAGKPVSVTMTTGQTVAASLAWTAAASCFIAIWGAGLAKYRWIGNKPGLVLTSRHHLLNPAEMSIYHSPLYMADPAPLAYADPACVEDAPDADQLVPVSGPRHVSFRVDEALFFAQVDVFLAPFLAEGSA